ncbi:unnamed protein product [Camellia sinensis]
MPHRCQNPTLDILYRNHTVPKLPNFSANPILSIIMKIGFSIRVFTEEEKMTKINRFTEKTAAFFNTATHFLRRIKRGKVLRTNRWFKFKPIAKFLGKRRPINKKRVARQEFELSCIQSKLDLINRKVLVAIQLLLNNVPPTIQIKSKYGFSSFLKMRSHGYRGKLIFLNGIGEDVVGELLEEAEEEGIDYELPTTLGYFDGHNFTKRSDIENAKRARERAREAERARQRAREAEYSLMETAKTSDEDAVVDDHSSSYSFTDHWRYNDHFRLLERAKCAKRSQIGMQLILTHIFTVLQED